MRDAILEWYVFLASLGAPVRETATAMDARVGIPLISALLLGVIGAAAPCQISQSVGMLAVLGRHDSGRPRWRATLAYVGGKALVYSALGLLAVALGAGLSEVSIPIFVAVRKLLGPLMVVIGLAMVGALRFRWAPGAGLFAGIGRAVRCRADGAPALLGIAFGFSFCPTLFGLFFGFLIPLALTQPDGLLYPAVFALGTTVPLLAILGLLSVGGGAARHYAERIGRWQGLAAVAAGVTLIVVGLNDTVVYWLL